MGKELRLLTERDLEGKYIPQSENLFHCLVMVAQVARDMYIAEKLHEKEEKDNDNLQCATTQQDVNLHGKKVSNFSKDKKKELIQDSFQDKRYSVVKRNIGEKSIILEGGSCEDTSYIHKKGFLIRSRTGKGASTSQNSGLKVVYAKKERKTIRQINAPLQQNLKPEFLNRILNMGGTDIKLIIEKDIHMSDLVQRANRLSIPINQIREDAQDFLTEDEKNTLEKRNKKNRLFCLKVPLIEPNLQMEVIKLRKWKMKNVYLYLLSSTWYGITVRNKLEKGDMIQVWSFRVQEQLHLALVNLSKDYLHDNCCFPDM